MSALETLSAEQKQALDELLAKVQATQKAQADADAATTAAQQAADAAQQAADEIGARKKDAETHVAEVEKLLAQLSPRQRDEINGPTISAPVLPILGTGVGVRALKAAATQLGKPYQWGATGPNSYDCSGLTSWAFRQAGITLPRSSSQQATVGQPVSWDQLQPGDLVFYYHPVSHVGIYAGDGKFINAPQTGDVVRYQTVSKSAFSGARRL
nr:NlpC/P60 family protein [Pseudonocardia acidicola]